MHIPGPDAIGLDASQRVRRIRAFAARFLLLANAGVAASAWGVDLSWKPQAQYGMRIYDNVRWSPNNAEEAAANEGGGGFSLMAQSDTWSSELLPRANIRRFFVGNNLDADEYSVSTKNAMKWERALGKLDFSYNRDSTLVSEATTAGLRNDIADRDTIDIEPSLTYEFDDRTSAQFGFTYNDVSFMNAGASNLVDYTFMQASAMLTRQIDEMSSFFVQDFVTDFRTPDANGKTRSYGGQVGYTRLVAEGLQADATVGYVTSDIEFDSQQLAFALQPFPHLVVLTSKQRMSSGGPIASFSLRKKFERDTATFTYSRQVSPSARGSQFVADDIRLNLVHPITSKVHLTVAGSYDMSNAEGDRVIADLNRDQAEISAAFEYRLTTEFTLQAYYRFVWVSAPANSGAVDANAFFFGVRYNGTARPLLGGVW